MSHPGPELPVRLAVKLLRPPLSLCLMAVLCPMATPLAAEGHAATIGRDGIAKRHGQPLRRQADGQVELDGTAPEQASAAEAEPEIRLAQLTDAAPIDPSTRGSERHRGAGTDHPGDGSGPDAETEKSSGRERSLSQRAVDELLGDVEQLSRLAPLRRERARSPGADAVFGSEAKARTTTDVGSLLEKSRSARGVSTQKRNPLVSDTRVRGQRVGQVLASGSYWAPVRFDLDTMMNKIDSRLIDDLIVIKGPYSPRYGPGFRFVDLELISTPRFADGFEMHAVSSVDYSTNGEQWYGRQSFYGGDARWGYYVSYGHRTGNDYTTGNGDEIPSSYQSRDLFVALGRDLDPYRRIEFTALRLDQTDVEFPGLVYDINTLVTDGYEIKYVDELPTFADRITAELWYNRTWFNGDNLRPGKNAQIPTLPIDLGPAVTDGDGLSAGYREEFVFGDPLGDHWAVGTDFIFQNQELNDIELLAPPDDNNFPLPRSKSSDVGFYAERVWQAGDDVHLSAGGRFDMVFTHARDWIEGVPISMEYLKEADLDQQFYVWSLFLTGDVQLTEHWSGTFGVGHGQRPPTLTELYVESSFIGSLQRGVTFLIGDPLLNEERLTQIDIGLQAGYENAQAGLLLYHAWVQDYITYDLIAASAAAGLDGLPQGAIFTNTDLATLAGFEAYLQARLAPNWTVFANSSFLRGRDHTRNEPSRLSGWDDRSDVPHRDSEPLPGIPPLDTRLGIVLHDAAVFRRWAIEFSARVVDHQDRVATSLEEISTPGFTTYDLRSYRRLGDWLAVAGVENLTDKYYREHLDYRSGLGVFRPGVNFYLGFEKNW